MSHKLDAPATLNVVSEGVQIAERSLKFAASKDQKRFALDLTLYADIDPEVRGGRVGKGGEGRYTLYTCARLWSFIVFLLCTKQFLREPFLRSLGNI